MSSINVTNIKHPSSASNNIVLDSSGNVVLQAGSVSTPALQPSGDTNTGIFFPAADTIAFAEGGSEAMRIDSAARLLVGTSSSSADATLVLMKHSGDANGPGILHLSNPNSAPGSGAGLGLIRFSNSTQNTFASIEAYADAASGSNDYPGRLVFSTTADGASSPTERVRIGNAGNISSFADSANPSYTIRNASTAGTSTVFIQGLYSASSTTSGGTPSFYVFTNGNIQNTNNSYGALSDAKLKENIVDAGSQWDDLKAFQVRKYNFKEGQTHTQIGLIAQEVELVSPGLVYETPDRDEDGNETGEVTKGVNYSVLYMKAVKALQETMERIEVLEQRLADAGIA